MFSFLQEKLSPRSEQYVLLDGYQILTFAQVADLWQTDESFRNVFGRTIADCREWKP